LHESASANIRGAWTVGTASQLASRRLAAKGAGALAAVLALPAATVVAPAAHAEPEVAHDLARFHRVWRLPDTDAELQRLSRELGARVPPEVGSLHDDIVNLSVDRGYDEQDMFVGELARRFPGLAPAIRYVAYHHISEQRLAERDACCEGPPAA
jgi:hypothetical protein